jgi:two-component system chemotaxis response regulator CheY
MLLKGGAKMATVVVIDGSAIVRKRLRTILESAGHSVVGEGDCGQHAIALYDHLRPNLLTLDIVLPGKDGVIAAAEIVARHPEARIVMCTSIIARDKIVACHRAGVAHYLLKPFDEAKVKAIVKFALAMPAGRRAPNTAAPLGNRC